MSLAIVYSRATIGMAAPLITVEVHLSNGLPRFDIVGLPEVAVKESKDRVRSALMNTQFEFPIRRITVNLAPADLPKEGCRFDLPIALGILAASGQLPIKILSEFEFIGELALSGELRGLRGILPVVLGMQHTSRHLIIPEPNAAEAGLVKQSNVFTATHLLEVCAHLKGFQSLPACDFTPVINLPAAPDLQEVKGQMHAKRALEIAAAGRHSLLLSGPPGTGKTMLASRLSSILPPLTNEEALEVAAILSISHTGFKAEDWQRIPFRSPHHTSSSVALVGGGRPPRPGEISLAHHGVLFLDELPEFNRHVLECLREPLESGSITISRAAIQMIFPADFQFITAMNPCPCGFYGSQQECRCSADQISRYVNKISGPLLDRIDMQIQVVAISPELLHACNHVEENSQTVRERVMQARQQQLNRQGKCNSRLSVQELKPLAIQPEAIQLINKSMTTFNLSARVYHRLLKIARTIADLEGETLIKTAHIAEGLTYRFLDKIKPISG